MSASDTRLIFWYDARSYELLDRFASYFGATPLIVDPGGRFKRGRAPESVGTLDEALALCQDHSLVFLDAGGDIILEQYDHPTGPVVYAVGDNVSGFGRQADELPGDVVRLGIPGEVWDYQVAMMTLYSRFVQVGI